MTPEEKAGRSDCAQRGTLETGFSGLCYLQTQKCTDSLYPRFDYSDFPWILQTTPCPSNTLFY